MISYFDVGRDSTDETNKFVISFYSHSAVPLGQPARGKEGPTQETVGIIKAEHVIVIFHVVFIQQVVKFCELHCEISSW
jgi:hypothetical protein